MVGWILSFLTAVPAEIPWGLYIVSYVLTGWFLVQDVAYRLRQGQFDIDSLMLLAAAGAAYLDKWAEGALLLVLFSIGHALESYAMGRAKRAIEALTKLAPAIAHVRRGEELVDLPVEELTVGDVVVIKPGERVSADGFVISGNGSVDQAPVTGESVPVDKHPVENIAEAARSPERLSQEHRVFAGTLNGAHALEIHVTKSAADNTLARVIKMVSEAENRVSPTQTFTRRIERYFVPTVLAFDVLLLFAWLVIDEPVSASLYRAMSVLVAASPCALAIATPSAVLSGVARAARGGVLIKGGGPLESLGTIHAIAFDKTGTLTEGKPRITDVVPLFGSKQEQLLRVAVAVESLTDHPLASAVVRDARAMLRDSDLPRADDLQILIGRGVKARVDGLTAMIGNAKLFQTEVGSLPEELAGKMEQLQSAGRTTMIVRHGDQYLGVLGIMDTPRPSAPSVTRELKQLGIRRLLMLSGDHQQVADAVAKSVGITEASGDLLPEDKVRIIRTLGDEEGVAMVGDGVNDAPAMANATIGIAMGAAGSDVALETADIALMGDDLTKLPFAVGLSRKTRTIIRQNVFISMGMVFFLVPAAALGLPLGPAVVLHEGSTIVVALNALRLLFYKAAELPASSPEAPNR
ncbi:MAG: heavy metal translocating P-type ATPase [Pirellulales bacterium]